MRVLLVFISLLLEQICSQVLPVTREGCGTSKGCFFSSNDCNPEVDCFAGVTFIQSQDGKSIDFELVGKRTGNPLQYVAVGFSSDTSMGEDSVTACIFDMNTAAQATIILAYNPGQTTPVTISPQPTGITRFIESGQNDDVIYCRFSQTISLKSNNSTLRSLNQRYFLLLASGESTVIQRFKYHNQNRVASADSLQLTSAVESKSSTTKFNLQKTHGICMIFGWWVFAATAILFARYFKAVWPNTKPFDLLLWFHFHRSLHAVGLALIIAGFVCIFVAERWGVDGPHQICGFICVILALTQPFGALFRCHPGTPKRPIFNWVHRGVGLVAWILGAITIILATDFESQGLYKGNNGSAPLGVMIFYLIVLLLCVGGFEFLITVTERMSQPSHADVTNGMALPPIGATHGPQPQPIHPNQPKTSPRWSIFRVAILCLFVVVAVGVAIALTVMIATYKL